MPLHILGPELAGLRTSRVPLDVTLLEMPAMMGSIRSSPASASTRSAGTPSAMQQSPFTEPA